MSFNVVSSAAQNYGVHERNPRWFRGSTDTDLLSVETTLSTDSGENGWVASLY